ncbi:MAG TPA: cell division protein FtsH, partial [Methylophilaceae bacterium]|nr:cell division protein FtsH [Methylophilaceae bacterium]
EANRDKVEAMVAALLQWETVDAEQINDIMAGLAPRPPKPSQPTTTASRDTGGSGPTPAPAAQPAAKS